MTTNEERAIRWATTVGTDKFRSYARNSNVFGDSRQLYSYGYHFPLARVMFDGQGNRSWFLVNGDNYSVSTSRHQSITRSAIKRTALDSMIIPFSALTRAGIITDSIAPVEIMEDTFREVTRSAANLEDVPEYRRPLEGFDSFPGYHDAQRGSDGRWSWQETVHQLGAAVFRADYRYTDREHLDENRRPDYPVVSGSAYFLSAFDEQEPAPLYFLAQLPAGAAPGSYAEALAALQPDKVKAAIAAGADVQRQGDIFAIPAAITTRRLSAMGGDRERGAYVLGVNHTATETVTLAVRGTGTFPPSTVTYARGIMRHRPREFGRRPEHRSVKLGDRKSWYELVKNTVPMGRSWSLGGRVD